MAAVFLVIGALGLVVLLLSLFVGELGELGLGTSTPTDPSPSRRSPRCSAGSASAAPRRPRCCPTALPGRRHRPARRSRSGLAVAVPLAWGAVRLSRALKDMPTQETLTRHHLVGAQGVVVSAVPSPGFGEVRLAAGRPAPQVLRPQRRAAARPGTPVYVVEALSETAVEVVSTAPEPPHPLPEPGGTPMTLLYAIGGIAVLVLLLVLLVLSRIKVAGPNQAFMVTGRQGRQVTERRRASSPATVRPEGRHGRERLRAAGRAEAAHDGPVQPPHPGRHPRAR